jgi:amidophosphoribosyltransferase
MRKEFCGIFGVYNGGSASELTYLGLYGLQHRGQESAGIVSAKGGKFYAQKGMGLVSEVFSQQSIRKLKGDIAIGHVRYSSTGGSTFDNIQPLIAEYQNTPIAIAHNGNIPNAAQWKKKLEQEGIIFSTRTDSELILKLLVREKEKWEERLKKALDKLQGAFSVIVLVPGKLIGARDGYGFRPLSIGKREEEIFFSSESCAFDIVEAEFLRDIEPGEIVAVDSSGMKSLKLKPKPARQCVFELIYFSRPDSRVFSRSVYNARLNMGKELAKEKPIDADLVMPVPDSANVQALGYSRQSGIPMDLGFIRNHYIGRTFIEPHQKIRDLRVKIKHTAIKEVLEGKRVILIDDSIVRGTTSRKLINLIRNCGAKEVHLLISSPPIRHSCFYGIDTPTKKELIANRMNVSEIKKYLGVDTLHYLSMEGLLRACGRKGYCLACFTGKYPMKNEKR